MALAMWALLFALSECRCVIERIRRLGNHSGECVDLLVGEVADGDSDSGR